MLTPESIREMTKDSRVILDLYLVKRFPVLWPEELRDLSNLFPEQKAALLYLDAAFQDFGNIKEYLRLIMAIEEIEASDPITYLDKGIRETAALPEAMKIQLASTKKKERIEEIRKKIEETYGG